MDSKKITRAEMIRRLAEIIEKETSKDFEDMDYDLVAECGELLDRLMGKRRRLSEREIRKKINLIKARVDPELKKTLRRRKLMKVLITAAAVMCMSVTVLAIPQIKIKLLQVLQLAVGESTNENEVTYIHSGQTKHYADIDSLIKTEDLNILSFEDSQGEIKITNIKSLDSVSITTVSFNDPEISCTISHNQNCLSENIVNESKEYVTPYFTAYIFSNNISEKTIFNAYIYYDKDTYAIECPNLSTLYKVLDSLKKGD